MSQDQKPAKMKPVSVGASAPADGADDRQAAEGAGEEISAPEAQVARPTSGPSLFLAMLLLAGCAAGGAGLAALPHYAPDLAARLGGHSR